MKRAGPLILLLTVVLGAGFAVQEEGGNRAHRRGEYSDAVERYREALPKHGSPRLHYNLGTALLMLGDAAEAQAELAGALQAQEPELRLRAFYNLGNAYAAEATEGPEGTEQLEATIDAYRRALLLDPESEDAKWNLELALRRLEELESPPSTSGPQEQPLAPPRDDSSEAEQSEPQEGEGPPGVPQPGGAAPEREPRPDSDTSPLPRELAEQILRAVEEQERGLQREKLRRRPMTRTPGPDW